MPRIKQRNPQTKENIPLEARPSCDHLHTDPSMSSSNITPNGPAQYEKLRQVQENMPHYTNLQTPVTSSDMPMEDGEYMEI